MKQYDKLTGEEKDEIKIENFNYWNFLKRLEINGKLALFNSKWIS